MTKKLRFAVILTAILCLTVAGAMSFHRNSGVTYAEESAEGLWTEVSDTLPSVVDGEYHVTTPAEFGAFVKKWNDGTAGGIASNAKVVIDNSLDFTGRYFVPLGTAGRPFTGELRGNAYTFKGVTYVGGDENHRTAAIVAELGNGGVVQQLGVVVETDLAGYQYAGGIVGQNLGTVHSCFALHTRYATRAPMSVGASGSVVGGIVALNYGKVYNCYAGGSITLTQTCTDLTYGGVVGKNEKNFVNRGLLAYSYSTESTDWAGYEPQNAGGVAGASYTASEEAIPDSIWYSYYRKEGSACQTAVAGAQDNLNKKVQALSDEQFGTGDYRELFPSSVGEITSLFGTIPNNWTRSLTSLDGSAYYAPVLNGFHANSREDNAKVAEIRRYGMKATGIGEWGSKDNPFLIGSVQQWKAFAENVNRNITYEGKFFELSDRLDFNGEVVPQAGGHLMTNGDRSFRGTFDGNNNRFTDFRLEAYQDYAGFFGYVDRVGTVKNVEVSEGEVSGTRYVGVLVGYLTGTVENVRVYKDVKVTGNAYLGGVIGASNAGTLKSVVAETELDPNSGTSNVYGIAGASNSTSAEYCWYVTDSQSAYLDAGCGASLIVDVNGTVTISKAGNGNISFGASGDVLENIGGNETYWTPEYRTQSEEVLLKANSDTARSVTWQVSNSDSAKNMSGRVYVRFLKTVTFGTSDYGLELPMESGRYYQGQTANVSVKPVDGYYLNEVEANRFADGASLPDPNVKFSYLSDRDGIRINFNVTKEVRSIFMTSEAVGAPSVLEQNNDRLVGGEIEYNGKAVKYEFAIENYQINLNWSSGTAPVNVGSGSYTLTVSVMLDGVQRGYARQIFGIAKRPVTVTENALVKVKEFDGKKPSEYVVLPVNVQEVEGLIAGDSVFINARAKFGSDTVTTRTSVTYDFDLSGAASNNYRIGGDSAFSVSDGAIVPKTVVIKIEPEHLKKTYDASPAVITVFGYDGDYQPIQEYPMEPRFRFVKTHDATGNIYGGETLNTSDAGTYRPEVYDAGRNAAYYNLLLYPEFTAEKDPNYDGVAYYEYVIERAKVQVTFTDYENRQYKVERDDQGVVKGVVQSISAYYYGTGASRPRITVSPEEIEYRWESMPYDYTLTEQAVLFLNAGWYTATLNLKGNYVADDTNGANSIRFKVDKIKQESMILQLPKGLSVYDYGCEPVELIVNEIEKESAGLGTAGFNITGFAKVVDGNKLDFTGGGTVTVQAYREEGINYFSNRSNTLTVTVNKLNLQVALKDLELKYGDPVEFEFQYTGLANRDQNVRRPAGMDEPTVCVDGVAHTKGKLYDVNTYTLTFSAENSCSSDGYIITLGGGAKTLTVLRRSVTVAANSVEQVYGDFALPLSYTVWEDGVKIDFKLNGTLSRAEGNIVGSYPILQGSVTAENNPNVDLTFQEGSYDIVPRTLTMVVKPMRKTYGQPDPIPQFDVSGLALGERISDVVSGQITREPGENAYTATTNYGFYRYLSTGLTVNENYTLNFVTVNGDQVGNLYIDPAEPVFGAVWHGEIAYGQALNTVFAEAEVRGVNGETLFGELQWANPDTVPDFGEEEELTFEIVFTPRDKNYVVKSSSAVLSLKKQEIGVSFQGSKTVSYNGQVHSVTYTFTGTEETPACETNWSATPLNAGSYTLTVTVTEKRFVLKGENTFQLTVSPATLTIGLKDVTYVLGATPKKEFTYSGFVNGETEKSLTKLPDVTFNGTAGNHTVTPFGAEGANYNIRYTAGKEVVLKPETTAEGFVWKGTFSGDTSVTVVEAKKDEKVYDEYNLLWLKTRIGQDYAKYEISALYGVSLTTSAGENVYGDVGFTLPENLRNNNKLGVVIFTKGGEAQYVEVEREGDVVWFKATDDMAYFAVVAPASYTLYYIIGGAAIVVVLALVVGLVLIVRARKKRKEAMEAQIVADYLEEESRRRR